MSEDVSDTSLIKFTTFSEARDLPNIISSFTDLCHEVHLDPDQCEDFYTSLKQKLQQWRCKELWQLLDSRAALSEYQAQTVCKGKRVLIVGAGPVGLRSAIEAALLGAKVDIVEKRTSFSRNNVLHLWPFLIDDLRALGAKKFYGRFCAGAIDHISIKILQEVLLKVCLILGVKVHFPVTFQDLIEPRNQSDHWHVKIQPGSSPVSSHSYDAIISADGKQYSLPGFHSKEFRAKLAIAITANFVNHRTNQETSVEEISGVAFIYNQSFFKELAQKHGIDLENIVYYKDETHYFVMTAKKSSLLAKGVIKNDSNNADMLLARKNIDQKALENYAKEAATFSTKGGLGDLEFALNHREEHDVAIFDFTSLFASEHASRIVERKGKRLLLCVAGDTLLEPFWPTGSGLARGFLGAFDAAWMLKRFCEGAPPLDLIEEREAIFRLLPSTTPQKLQKKTAAYTIDPHTRYPILNTLVPTTDVSHLYDSDTVPKTPVRETKKDMDIIIEEAATTSKMKRVYSMESRDKYKVTHPLRPTLESIRASQSPEPIGKGDTAEQQEEIVVEEPKPKPKTEASSEFSLFKFARLLFGKKNKGKDKDTREVEVKSKKSQTPERKTSSGSIVKEKHKEKAKEKNRDKSPKKVKQEKTKSKAEKKLVSDPKSSREKHPPVGTATSDHKNVNAVQQLTQLYESNETQSSGMKKDMEQTGNVIAKGSVASAIKRLEQHGKGEIESTDYELMSEEECDVSIDLKREDSIQEEVKLAEIIDVQSQETEPNIDTSYLGSLTFENEMKRVSESSHHNVQENVQVSPDLKLMENTELNENKDLEPENEDTEHEIENLKIENESTCHENEDTEHENKDLEHENEDTEYENKDLEIENEDMEVEIEDLEKAEELESDLEDVEIEERIEVKTDTPLYDIHLPKEQTHIISTQLSLLNIKQSTDVRSVTPTGLRQVTSPERHFMSKDDSIICLKSRSVSYEGLVTPKWLQNFTASLTNCLETLRTESINLYSLKTTLEVLNFIFSNIMSDPNEDTYRRVRITSDHFHCHVWQYTGAQEFMWLCGWMEISDYLVLPVDQSLDVPKKVLDRQIETIELMMQSEHIDNILSGKISHLKQSSSSSEHCYTDTVVMRALNKTRRDHSIMMASALKEEISKRGKELDNDLDEIDQGRITKEEEALMMLSASQARAWWEKKLQRHPSTYSLYFQHDEIEELKYIADYNGDWEEESVRGVVAERVKAFEKSSNSDEEKSPDNSLLEEVGGAREDDNNEGHVVEVWQQAVSSSSSSAGGGIGEKVWSTDEQTIVQIASQNVRQIWDERTKGNKTNIEEKDSNEEGIVSTNIDDIDDPTHLKWHLATRASEQFLQKKQLSLQSSSEQTANQDHL